MKRDYWIIVIVVLLLIAVGGMMKQETIIGQQQEALIAAQTEQDRLTAITYWTHISRLPQPHSPPLEQIRVSSGCGYRMDPMGGGTEGLHKGKDFAAAVGTPVKATLAGVVAEHWLVPGWHWGKEYHGHPIMGGYIVIDHGEGLFSCYGHLSATFIHEENYVEAGQVIGEVGNMGISTGPHLHFEIVVDPLRYLEER